MWEQAVAYIASHGGRWVPGFEVVDHVYSGAGSPHAAKVLIYRARKAGVPVESSMYGYRIGRQKVRTCTRCNALTVIYPDGEVICYSCVGAEYADLEVGRAPYAEGTRQGVPWTEDERQFVLAHMHEMTLEELAEGIDRTVSAVRGFLFTNGLHKPYVRRNR